eukprot:SAG11_NODE_533_length_8703_cov_7.183054_4_plen_146_part_00
MKQPKDSLNSLLRPPAAHPGHTDQRGDIIEVLEEQRGDVLGYIGPGTYFGENFAGKSSQSRRERTITAVVNSELAYLRIEDLQSIQERFPLLKKHVNQHNKLRRKLQLPKTLFQLIDANQVRLIYSDSSILSLICRGLGQLSILH